MAGRKTDSQKGPQPAQTGAASRGPAHTTPLRQDRGLRSGRSLPRPQLGTGPGERRDWRPGPAGCVPALAGSSLWGAPGWDLARGSQTPCVWKSPPRGGRGIPFALYDSLATKRNKIWMWGLPEATTVQARASWGWQEVEPPTALKREAPATGCF